MVTPPTTFNQNAGPQLISFPSMPSPKPCTATGPVPGLLNQSCTSKDYKLPPFFSIDSTGVAAVQRLNQPGGLASTSMPHPQYF
jgi:hypothetical protein